MPRSITELSARKPRGNAKYQWDEWMQEGNTLAFTHGTKDEVASGDADFSCKPSSFEVQVRGEAAKRGLSASLRTPDDATVEARFTVADTDDDDGPDADTLDA